MAEPKDWSGFRKENGLKVGERVTLGPLDDEGVKFFRACGFKVVDGVAECVVASSGVAKAPAP